MRCILVTGFVISAISIFAIIWLLTQCSPVQCATTFMLDRLLGHATNATIGMYLTPESLTESAGP